MASANHWVYRQKAAPSSRGRDDKTPDSDFKSYKHCRGGEGPEKQELCDKADGVVVDLYSALQRSFGHIMPEYQARLHADVLMADGRVPFTTAAFTRDYHSKPHYDKNDLMRLCFCIWLYGGEGSLPPGGHFVLSDWGIKLRAKAGAVVYFDSPTVRHHSERPTQNGPQFAPRMACALFVSQKVFDAYDKQSAERKERRIKATQKRIKQNMQMRAQERAKNNSALPAQQGAMQKKKVATGMRRSRRQAQSAGAQDRRNQEGSS
ncbi:hypothetical protein CVIRNUC_003153 [Coccomyxa viridis]|uniref:Prolyl 4-hydroxylase alpha subunit Fe(2+) 2OG dioxygenase domain-containing protein n=1 Tax=Coccomyxa viridis TaxID=1274662 RepID=A0AAV1HYK3_9CHLO|nr:hypothetical protein CVIRNUC_003153 [Coccomyxa viridis]